MKKSYKLFKESEKKLTLITNSKTKKEDALNNLLERENAYQESLLDLDSAKERQQNHHATIQTSFDEIRNSLVTLTNDQRELRIEIKEQEGRMEILDSRIAFEIEKSARFNTEKRQLSESQIVEIQSKIEELQIKLNEITAERSVLYQEMNKNRQTEEEMIQNELAHANQLEKDIIDKIVDIQKQKSDSLLCFGPNMIKVVNAIKEYEKQGKWTGSTPIGPFGLHVRVQDKKYVEIAETILKHFLSGFGVETLQDARLLDKILRKHNWYFFTFIHMF